MSDNDDLLGAGEGEPAPAASIRTRGTAAAPIRTTARAEPRVEGQRDQVRTRSRQRPGTIDKFHVDAHLIPEGWSYEWKRISVLGAEVKIARDPSYEQHMAENAWEPVPASRHPGLMPEGSSGAIIRDGLMLMERPMALTLEARAEDRQMAREQVQVKEQQLSSTPSGTFTRDHASARAVTKVSKSYEAMPIPAD